MSFMSPSVLSRAADASFTDDESSASDTSFLSPVVSTNVNRVTSSQLAQTAEVSFSDDEDYSLVSETSMLSPGPTPFPTPMRSQDGVSADASPSLNLTELQGRNLLQSIEEPLQNEDTATVSSIDIKADAESSGIEKESYFDAQTNVQSPEAVKLFSVDSQEDVLSPILVPNVISDSEGSDGEEFVLVPSPKSGGTSSYGSSSVDTGTWGPPTVEALQQRAAAERVPERRQFNCEFHGLFWKKVPANKPVASCKDCKALRGGVGGDKLGGVASIITDATSETATGVGGGAVVERLEAVPKTEERGSGTFCCVLCSHTWVASTCVRGLAQYCDAPGCTARATQTGTYPVNLRPAKPFWVIQRDRSKWLRRHPSIPEHTEAAPVTNSHYNGGATGGGSSSSHGSVGGNGDGGSSGGGSGGGVAAAGGSLAGGPLQSASFASGSGTGGSAVPIGPVSGGPVAVSGNSDGAGSSGASVTGGGARRNGGGKKAGPGSKLKHFCSGCATGACKLPPPISKRHVSTGSTAPTLSQATWSTASGTSISSSHASGSSKGSQKKSNKSKSNRRRKPESQAIS